MLVGIFERVTVVLGWQLEGVMTSVSMNMTSWKLIMIVFQDLITGVSHSGSSPLALTFKRHCLDWFHHLFSHVHLALLYITISGTAKPHWASHHCHPLTPCFDVARESGSFFLTLSQRFTLSFTLNMTSSWNEISWQQSF
jgi:hypothetical protein